MNIGGIQFKQAGNMIWSENQAEGAIKNGAEIIKCNSEPGDAHKDGSIGIVMGSVPNPPQNQMEGKPFVQFLYFIKWSDFVVPVGTMDFKIKEK